jgi:Dipeptidyl peptidase IV (DPP IV) N-terminal region/WD40-like Beta Propeller Repeat
MRLTLSPHRLATAAVIAGGAVGLLAGAGPASATVPGNNGLIVTTKCQDVVNCSAAHLWTIDPVTGSETQLTSDPAHYDDDPTVSPDGSHVAYRRCTDSSGKACTIALIGIGGGTPTDLTSAGRQDFPAFSPDGTKIVFSKRDASGYSHLVLMDANGANPQPLTSGAVSDDTPAWSPDGSTIVFDRYDGSFGTRVYKIAPSGGSPTQLTTGKVDYSPSFSPDGTHIVFGRDSTIQLMDANGANLHTLTDSGQAYISNEPVFSPDGTKIVFERYALAPPNPTPLIMMNADGSNVHPITSSSEAFYGSDWQATHPAPPAPPAPAPPSLTLNAPKKESIRKGRLYVFATSSTPVVASASGKVAVPKLTKGYGLRRASKSLPANARTKIWVKLPRKTLRASKSALTRHQRVKATLLVQVKDGSGKTATKQIKVRLTK